MSEKNEDTDRVRPPQVFAGALAAVTAALIGSTMGVAGTVLGAGLASVISTVGGTVYLRSIKRTTEGVRTVHAKVVGKSGGSTVLVTSEDPDADPGTQVEADTSDEPADRPPATSRRRWAVLALSTLAAFALGMVVVTGVEWLRGEPLSGGEGNTTFGSIVAPHNAGGGGEDRSGDPTTSTTTPTTTTTTDTPDPTTTSSDPTTTSTTPPSESRTTTTTTTTPPVTTTTDDAAPGGTIPPSN